MTFPFPFIPPLVSSGGPVVITYRDEDSASGPSSPKTFTAMATGTAAADRYVIAALVGLMSGAAISGVTIGGVAAARQVTKTLSAVYLGEIWTALVPTGTTANVVVTFTGSFTNMGAITWSMTGAASGTAVDTGGDTDDSNPLTDTIDIPANGGAVGLEGNNAGTAVTWTNLTEDVDVVDASGRRLSGASRNDTVAQTALAVSVTGGNTGIFAMASFGP